MTRRQIAFHEAGHAAVAEALGLRVSRATIIPTAEYLGCADVDHDNCEAGIVARYAGPLAMARCTDRAIRFALGRHASVAVLHCGGEDDLRSAAYVGGLDKQFADPTERRAYLRWLWERARVEVDRHWPEVEAVAAALLERRTLTGAQVRRCIAAVRSYEPPEGAPFETPGWLDEAV